jgi:hypothetical protein
MKLRVSGRHQPNRWISAQVTDVINGSLLAELDQRVPALSRFAL